MSNRGLKEELFDDKFESLLVEYLAEGDSLHKESLRSDLVAHCIPYVQRIARGLARRGGDPVDDLIQVGCMGLMKALDKYNPLAGTRFKTYATYLITGEIRHYLRDKASLIKAPRQMYELYYRMNQIIQQLTEELQRVPTDEEIAEALECPVEKIHDVGLADRRRMTVSLDQFVTGTDSKSGDMVYIEKLSDAKYHEFLQNQENRILLDQAMDSLKPELRAVIEMTYFKDMSQMEIAKVLGISQMQVSRRLRKALEQMHSQLHYEGAERRFR